jgi:CRP/FNR family transcriptional regulator, anaerobic regulatory protein
MPRTEGRAPHARRIADIMMRELSVGVEADTIHQLDAMTSVPTRLQKGDPLYRSGEAFSALYAIRVGSCKTAILAEDGREQITGYHILGDLIGADGIGSERYSCEAVALEDSIVCALSFERLEKLARSSARLQRNLHRFLSRDIGRDQHMMLLLGTMQVEERIAAFLLNLSERYRERGYSSTEFVLHMTRQEIGSFLGMKLETVSRVFSRLQEQDVILAHGRAVKILDLPALTQLAGRRA